jgi:hypothetical protein
VILSVDLTQQGASLSGDGDGTRQKRSYSANYIVKTDDPTTSTKAIEKHFKNNPPLPWYGRSWKWTGTAGNDSDPDSICKKFTVSHEPQSAGIFKVVAEFEPIDGDDKDKEKPSNSDSGDSSRDPLEWREQVSESTTQITIPVMFAIFRGFTSGQFGNDPYRGTNLMQVGRTYIPQASNLIPFDPLPEMELDIKVIRFTKNVPDWDSNAYDPWRSTVNEDAVVINKPNLKYRCGFSPYSARLKSISAQSDFQNGVSFFRREVEIWVNPNGWRGKLADMGMLCRPNDAADEGFVSPGDIINNPGLIEQVVLKDGDDYPASQPIPLNGYGKPRRVGEPDVYSNWSYYLERPWAPIANDF